MHLDEFPITEREYDNNTHFVGSVSGFGLDSLGFDIFEVKHRFPSVALNDRIQERIDILVRHPRSTAKLLEKAYIYHQVVGPILREQGMDPSFAWIMLIESSYDCFATSHAEAVGCWQFIESSADTHGLLVNRFIDERRDFEEAAYAAVSHLKTSYREFGDWLLSLAGYNWGDDNIKQAMRSSRTKNFWNIKRQHLPPETYDYVPKFIAAKIVGENPSHYGIQVNYQQREEPFFRKISLPLNRKWSMPALADYTNVDIELLKMLNPMYKTNHIPRDRRPLLIRVPNVGYERELATIYDDLEI